MIARAVLLFPLLGILVVSGCATRSSMMMGCDSTGGQSQTHQASEGGEPDAPECVQHRLLNDLIAAQQQTGDLLTKIHMLERDLETARAQLAAAQQDSTSTAKADLEAALARLQNCERQLAEQTAAFVPAHQELLQALRPHIDQGHIRLDVNRDRLLIQLTARTLFQSGDDHLSLDGVEILTHIGAVLKDYADYSVTVDGHTDTQPILPQTRSYPTNQALSEGRAKSAAHVLADSGLTIVKTQGFGESRPVAPNTTETGRAQNRRVEIRVTR